MIFEQAYGPMKPGAGRQKAFKLRSRSHQRTARLMQWTSSEKQYLATNADALKFSLFKL